MPKRTRGIVYRQKHKHYLFESMPLFPVLTESGNDESRDDFRVFTGVVQRRLHKAIELNQVSILNAELVKHMVKSKKYSGDEIAELVENFVSRTYESGLLLRDLQNYIREIECQLAKPEKIIEP